MRAASNAAGEHQVLPQPLPEGVVVDERFELAEGVLLATGGELEPDPVLDRPQAELAEPRDLALERGESVQVGERRAAPQSETVTEHTRCTRGLLSETSRLAQQRFEPRCIDLVRFDAEEVPGWATFDPLGAECSSEVVDVRLDRPAGPVRRLLSPQPVDQRVDRDDLVRAHEEMCQDGSLLRAAERHRPLRAIDFERTQDAEVHAGKVARTTQRGKTGLSLWNVRICLRCYIAVPVALRRRLRRPPRNPLGPWILATRCLPRRLAS
jgi:hypothetical protein